MNLTNPRELFGPGFCRTRRAPFATSSTFSAVLGMTAAAHDFHLMFADVRRVVPRRRHYFLQCDAVRHFPVRTKDQVSHVGGENRRLRRLECLSDDHIPLTYV